LNRLWGFGESLAAQRPPSTSYKQRSKSKIKLLEYKTLYLFCYNLKTLAQKFCLYAFMHLDIELAINQTNDVNRCFKQNIHRTKRNTDMGLAATSARKYMLMAYSMNIDYDLQNIAQSRLRLMSILDKVYAASNSLDPNNPVVQDHEKFISRLQNQDKRIALMQEKMKRQAEAIKTEIAGLDKMISEGIKQTFNYVGQA
jgi:hypothetical protein